MRDLILHSKRCGIRPAEFQDKVLDFEFKAMGADKKLARDKVFDFSIMKSLAAK
jgi:hypothetical protein